MEDCSYNCFSVSAFFNGLGSCLSEYEPISETSRRHVQDRQSLLATILKGEELNPVFQPPKQVTMQDDFGEIFVLGRKIGEGASIATVSHCMEKATGKEYACKSFNKKHLTIKTELLHLRREITIMCRLSGHPNVVYLRGVYEDANAIHIVMELCRGGELYKRLAKQRRYKEKEAVEVMRSIVSAINYCHSLGIMHRDLKPENFLYVDEREDSDLKLIDFGLSAFFKPDERFSYICGSESYIAPEVVLKRYGPEADIWSAGVILYVMLSGRFPFRVGNDEEFFGGGLYKRFKSVLEDDLNLWSDPWPEISESAKDLVRKMLDRNRFTRLTAQEVLSHPWILG